MYGLAGGRTVRAVLAAIDASADWPYCLVDEYREGPTLCPNCGGSRPTLCGTCRGTGLTAAIRTRYVCGAEVQEEAEPKTAHLRAQAYAPLMRARRRRLVTRLLPTERTPRQAQLLAAPARGADAGECVGGSAANQEYVSGRLEHESTGVNARASLA